MSTSPTKLSIRSMQGVDQILTWAALIAGALSLSFLTGMIVVDVTLRYLFNSPIFGGQDIGTLALIIIVTASIPYAARSGMHVFVEVLDKILGPLGRRVTDIISRIIGIIVISLLTWYLIQGAHEVVEFAETTPLLELSFGPFYLALAAGFGFYVLIMLLEIWVLLGHRKVPLIGHKPDPKEAL